MRKLGVVREHFVFFNSFSTVELLHPQLINSGLEMHLEALNKICGCLKNQTILCV